MSRSALRDGLQAESKRLHRARRAAEIALRDRALLDADAALSHVRETLARAFFAAVRGRPEAAALTAAAAAELERARRGLRDYYDQCTTRGNHDDHDHR